MAAQVLRDVDIIMPKAFISECQSIENELSLHEYDAGALRTRCEKLKEAIGDYEYIIQTSGNFGFKEALLTNKASSLQTEAKIMGSPEPSSRQKSCRADDHAREARFLHGEAQKYRESAAMYKTRKDTLLAELYEYQKKCGPADTDKALGEHLHMRLQSILGQKKVSKEGLSIRRGAGSSSS